MRNYRWLGSFVSCFLCLPVAFLFMLIPSEMDQPPGLADAGREAGAVAEPGPASVEMGHAATHARA